MYPLWPLCSNHRLSLFVQQPIICLATCFSLSPSLSLSSIFVTVCVRTLQTHAKPVLSCDRHLKTWICREELRIIYIFSLFEFDP